MTLQFRHIHKTFTVNQQPMTALEDIDLTLAPGELVAIIGASGCGKSTLLRLAAGLERAELGTITVNDQPLQGIPSQVSLVFQEARLFPWLTVEQNIELGMEQRALTSERKAQQVEYYLSLMGLSGFGRAFPHQLSGGMAQRVAIARGLAAQPDILLLDEPFGALDALKRQQLQDVLVTIRQHTPLSILLVTHDVEEALYLADRVVVMSPRPGRIRATLPITLPWPRSRTDSALQSQRQQLCDLL
ncbi:TPA: ABC transporter ATP-binding protein [Klebsiella pneumoniae]|nr:ABC transporter ATP-binding protein [Klebsiella pneumoniae]HBR1477760.1 ABC transporter ATP-binding protein [Klebsiella pneumoniae]